MNDRYEINFLISQISSGKLSYRSIRIYSETSSLIHGRKIIDSDEARKMFTKTIKVIQELYDANMILISGNNA